MHSQQMPGCFSLLSQNTQISVRWWCRCNLKKHGTTKAALYSSQSLIWMSGCPLHNAGRLKDLFCHECGQQIMKIPWAFPELDVPPMCSKRRFTAAKRQSNELWYSFFISKPAHCDSFLQAWISFIYLIWYRFLKDSVPVHLNVLDQLR